MTRRHINVMQFWLTVVLFSLPAFSFSLAGYLRFHSSFFPPSDIDMHAYQVFTLFATLVVGFRSRAPGSEFHLHSPSHANRDQHCGPGICLLRSSVPFGGLLLSHHQFRAHFRGVGLEPLVRAVRSSDSSVPRVFLTPWKNRQMAAFLSPSSGPMSARRRSPSIFPKVPRRVAAPPASWPFPAKFHRFSMRLAWTGSDSRTLWRSIAARKF